MMNVKKKLKDAWEDCWQACRDFCRQYADEIMTAQLIGMHFLLFSWGFFGPWICSIVLNSWQSGMVIAIPFAIIFSFALYFAGAAQYQMSSDQPADEFGFGAAAGAMGNMFVAIVATAVMMLFGTCVLLGMLLYSLTMQGWIYFVSVSVSFCISIPIEGICITYIYGYSMLFIHNQRKKKQIQAK